MFIHNNEYINYAELILLLIIKGDSPVLQRQGWNHARSALRQGLYMTPAMRLWPAQ